MESYKSAKNYLEELLIRGEILLKKPDEIEEFLLEIKEKSDKSFEENVFLPFSYLFEAFSLDEFEIYVVLLLSYKYLKGEKIRNIYEIIDIYALSDTKKRINCIKSLGENEKLYKFFLNNQSDDVELLERIINFGIFEEYENKKISKFASVTYGENAKEDFEFLHKSNELINFYNAHDKSFLFIEGPLGVGKKECVYQISKGLQNGILMVDLLAIVKKGVAILDEIMFEARLSKFGICFYNFEVLLFNEDYFEILDLITRAFEVTDLVICLSEEEWHPHKGFENYSVYLQRLEPPYALKRKNIWENEAKKLNILLGEDVDFSKLSNKFIFTKGQIVSILNQVKAKALDKEVLFSDIIDACKLALPSVPFGSKLIKINSKYKEEDLILPDYSKELLKTAVNRVNNGHIVYDEWGFSDRLPYGKGVSMIFAGPPGTGKTMGAQVVANLLSLDIYKINLAGVVSKYIGESEKNLEEVFDLGRKSQAILFFDEADVLFSKRTEVKDSNDKYSNMEAAFMLQKIEEYEGISILATNFIQNFDEAFKRRIKFIVDFPFPDETYRYKIWEKVFPENIPLSFDIDYKFLAEKFELSGSNIKNIAVNASFNAATQNEEVSMKQIIEALKIEYAKSGKKITKEELSHYFLMY